MTTQIVITDFRIDFSANFSDSSTLSICINCVKFINPITFIEFLYFKRHDQRRIPRKPRAASCSYSPEGLWRSARTDDWLGQDDSAIRSLAPILCRKDVGVGSLSSKKGLYLLLQLYAIVLIVIAFCWRFVT